MIIIGDVQHCSHCIYNTVIRLIFVVKIFSYAENIRNYFTQKFCYNECLFDEYLEQSTYAYAMHAIFVALRILEGYGWTHVYPSVLKVDRRYTRSERIALHHHSICRNSICYFIIGRIDISLNLVAAYSPSLYSV